MSVLCMLCQEEPATVFAGMGGEYSWCATCDAKSMEKRAALWNARVEEAQIVALLFQPVRQYCGVCTHEIEPVYCCTFAETGQR